MKVIWRSPTSSCKKSWPGKVGEGVWGSTDYLSYTRVYHNSRRFLILEREIAFPVHGSCEISAVEKEYKEHNTRKRFIFGNGVSFWMENGVSVGAYETHIHPKLSGAFPPGSSRDYSLCSVQFFCCIYINRLSVFIIWTCVFISVYFFPLINFHKEMRVILNLGNDSANWM